MYQKLWSVCVGNLTDKNISVTWKEFYRFCFISWNSWLHYLHTYRPIILNGFSVILLISPSLLKIWFYPNNTFATSFLIFSKEVFVKYPIGMTRPMESVSQYTRGEKKQHCLG